MSEIYGTLSNVWFSLVVKMLCELCDLIFHDILYIVLNIDENFGN